MRAELLPILGPASTKCFHTKQKCQTLPDYLPWLTVHWIHFGVVSLSSNLTLPVFKSLELMDFKWAFELWPKLLLLTNLPWGLKPIDVWHRLENERGKTQTSKELTQDSWMLLDTKRHHFYKGSQYSPTGCQEDSAAVAFDSTNTYWGIFCQLKCKKDFKLHWY